MKAQAGLRIGLTLAALLGATVSALADCPSLPDGPESYNVANGQQRALCLQEQVHDNTVDRNTQTRLNSLRTSMDQLQIQRRFDNLPPIAPPPPSPGPKSPGPI